MPIDPNQDRTKFIGGSEIAAIMGLSRWETPLSVWAQKTGKLTKDLSDNEAVEMGIDLEPFVAKKFMQRTGKKVKVDERDFTHPDYPFMKSHIDRWVLNEDGATLEAKTCSAWKANEWEGQEIPDEYYLQSNWNAGIVAAHRGEDPKSGYIAVLIGGQSFRHKPVKFSQVLFDKQVSMVKDFWENYVLKDVAPVAISDDKDTLVELFPDSRPDTLRKVSGDEAELELYVNQLAVDSMEGKSQIKDIVKDVDVAENTLRQLIEDGEGIETGQFKVTWKTQDSTSVDTEAMKDDEIYEKYKKTKQIRVLRIKEKKGKA